jgi:hypothetical protein
VAIIDGALLRYRRVMVMTVPNAAWWAAALAARDLLRGARAGRAGAGIRSVLDRHSRGAGAILATTGEGQMVVGAGVAGLLFDGVGNRF